MPEPRIYARRLVKGTTIVFTTFIASAVIGFLLRMFLARSLSLDEYGLFCAIFAFISFFGLFRGFGTRRALIKHIPEFEAQKQFGKIKSSLVFVLLFNAACVFFVATVLFVFSDQIALTVFGTTAAVYPFRIFIIWFILMIFFIFTTAFRGFQDMSRFAALRFFDILAVFLLVLLFVGILGLGVEGAAFAYLFTAIATGILGYVVLRHGYPQVFKAKLSLTKPLVKKLGKFALPVFLGAIGGLIIGYMDTLTITVLRSLPEVGLYHAAQPTAHVLWNFTGALALVFFPMVSELWAKREKKLLGNALHFLIKFSFILIIPAAFVFIAFPDIIIRLIFGSEYVAGATALQILGLAAIVYTPFLILSTTMGGIGRPIVVTKVVALMAGLNLVGNLLLVPPHGIEGAALATLGAYLLGVGLLFYYAWKFIKFTIPSSSLSKTVVGGVLTLLLIFGLKQIIALPPWPEAFVVMVPSLLFYGVWILMTKAITREDLRLIREVVPMPKWLVKAVGKLVRK